MSGSKFITSEPVELVRPRLGGVSSAVEQYTPHPSGTKFLFLDNVGDEEESFGRRGAQLAVARAAVAVKRGRSITPDFLGLSGGVVAAPRCG